MDASVVSAQPLWVGYGMFSEVFACNTHSRLLYAAGWVTEGEGAFSDMSGSPPRNIHQEALRGIAKVGCLARFAKPKQLFYVQHLTQTYPPVSIASCLAPVLLGLTQSLREHASAPCR